MKLLRWIDQRFNWPTFVLIAGLVFAALRADALAAVLWICGLVFGYVLAHYDINRSYEEDRQNERET